MLRRLFLAPLAALLLALPLLPAAPLAHAATRWAITAGGESDDHAVDVLLFSPTTITINVGDSIDWTFVGGEPHTVTFVSGGQLPPRLDISPTTGQPRLNPVMAFPAGPTTYDGTGYVNSGLVPLDPSQPPNYSLTFTSAGSFAYYCLLHPGMTGVVNVLASGDPPVDPTGVTALGKAQIAAAIARGQQEMAAAKVTTAPGPGSTTIYTIAAGMGDGTFALMRFLPPGLTINVGDSVVWEDRDPVIPHTVTFNPPPELGGPPPADLPPEAQLEFPPFFFQPTGGPTFNGQGFVNSALFGIAEAPAIGNKYQLTFTAAGTFQYVCLLHFEAGMVDAITVRAAGTPAPPPAAAAPATPVGASGGGDSGAQAAAAAAIALLGGR
jgi:plastocyanin